MAYDQVDHNVEILAAAKTYREISEQAWKITERFVGQRNSSIIDGIAVDGETTVVTHWMDLERKCRDGILGPSVVAKVVGELRETGPSDGTKIEEEVLVTEDGITELSNYPFDDDLLGHCC